MIALQLLSEPFSRTGNISAEGFRNLLGRPNLDLTKMVVREAIQNSIDAARVGAAPSVSLRWRSLTASERRAMSDRFFADLPASSKSRALIVDSLQKSHLQVLEIADFGTTGLTGPTRADVVPDRTDELDFVNLMRNVGAARDVHQGGGTYGYGKTSLYAVSACSTIVVDSVTIAAAKPVRRVMACHLGSAYESSSAAGAPRRFTGRHWWGILDREGGVDPAEGPTATELSTVLGMPARTMSETGTTIMIIDPLFDETDSTDVGHELLETVLWNFWPRMTQNTSSTRKLDVSLDVDGREIHVPKPEHYPPLDLFASALSDLRENARALHEIRSERPARLLGRVAIRPGISGIRSPSALRERSVIPSQSSHIALMRPVELVVKYIEGEPFPDRRYEWAGVFVCSDEDDIERAFARAEPPAHDDWVPSMLPRGRAKTYVNVALRRIDQLARTYVTPATPDVGELGPGPSLAATANRLGRILHDATTSGPGLRRTKKTSRKKTLSVSPARFVRLELDEQGRRVAIFSATITNDGAAPDLEVVAKPHLVMDGGSANVDDLPRGYDVAVRSIQLMPGDLRANSDELHVGTASGDLLISVFMPDRAAVGVRLSLRGLSL